MKTYAPALLVLAAGTFALCSTAGAQAPPPSLVACARLADPGQRLGCYDTQMAAMGATVAGSPPATPEGAPPRVAVPDRAVAQVAAPPPPPTAPVAAPPPPPVAAAPAATPEAKFGAEDIKPSARPKQAKEDKVLLSTITSIKQVRPKLFVIVLANGQIWMQDGTQITAFFRAGYDARIERGLLGDYRMSTTQTGEKNMVRVTRIQ
jgi:hypothetical protein